MGKKMVPSIRPGRVLRDVTGIVDDRLDDWCHERGPFLVLWVESSGRSVPWGRRQQLHTAVWGAALDSRGTVVMIVVQGLSRAGRARVLELEALDAS